MIISRCRSGSGCLNLTREVCDSTLVKVNTLVTFLLFVCTLTLGCVQVNAIATYTMLGFSVAALLTTSILVYCCRRERTGELVLQMEVPLETTEIVTESPKESIPLPEDVVESSVENMEITPPVEGVVVLDNSFPELEIRSTNSYKSLRMEFLSKIEPHNDLPPLITEDSEEESSEEINKRL